MDIFLASREQATRDSWKLIKRFLSDSWGKDVLIEKHKVPRTQHQNVAKQARQIRYCISQAIEYFEALKQSTTSTAPLQLYYGLMSLALAEVLVRGTGDVSLDRARQGNSSHGLELIGPDRLLSKESIALLKARPQLRDDIPYGTFALWHKFSNCDPVYGMANNTQDNVNTKHVSKLLDDNGRLNPFPHSGVSLQDCYSLLPEMQFAMRQLNLDTALVRSTITVTFRKVGGKVYQSLKVICHPSIGKNYDMIIEQFKVEPRGVENVRCQQLEGGFVFDFEREVGLRISCDLPSGISVADNLTYFYAQEPSLNEFGSYYVGAFILGNLCRYYPDYWMESVDRRTDFTFLADAFLESAVDRVPIRIAQAFCDTTFAVKELSL